MCFMDNERDMQIFVSSPNFAPFAETISVKWVIQDGK